jgi:hypothetical protein
MSWVTGAAAQPLLLEQLVINIQAVADAIAPAHGRLSEGGRPPLRHRAWQSQFPMHPPAFQLIARPGLACENACDPSRHPRVVDDEVHIQIK